MIRELIGRADDLHLTPGVVEHERRDQPFACAALRKPSSTPSAPDAVWIDVGRRAQLEAVRPGLGGGDLRDLVQQRARRPVPVAALGAERARRRWSATTCGVERLPARRFVRRPQPGLKTPARAPARTSRRRPAGCARRRGSCRPTRCGRRSTAAPPSTAPHRQRGAARTEACVYPARRTGARPERVPRLHEPCPHPMRPPRCRSTPRPDLARSGFRIADMRFSSAAALLVAVAAAGCGGRIARCPKHRACGRATRAPLTRSEAALRRTCAAARHRGLVSDAADAWWVVRALPDTPIRAPGVPVQSRYQAAWLGRGVPRARGRPQWAVSAGRHRKWPMATRHAIAPRPRPHRRQATRAGPALGAGGPVRLELLRRTTVATHPALLLRVADYPDGGVHGGHVAVVWNQRDAGYVLSLHFAARSSHSQSERQSIVLQAAAEMSRFEAAGR